MIPSRVVRGPVGPKGVDGNGILSVTRTSGTGAPGTFDTYTIAFTNGTNSTFQVYNGADASISSGAMTKDEYDVNDSGYVDSSHKIIVPFINKTGATLTKGTIVYLKTSSASANYPEAVKANASTEVTSSKTIGAVFEDVSNDNTGYIVTHGEVHNLDTSSYSVGDKLWLATTDGNVTTTKPSPPNHSVFIGTVTRSQASNGRISYTIMNGYEVDELHDVSLTGLANDDFFQRKGGLWVNRTPAQVKTDLNLSGTNTGDQTSIVGITGTKAQFNTAVTGGDFVYTASGTSFTTGSIPFANSSGELIQDNANLFFDDTNNRLGLGTSTPTARLEVSGSITLTAGTATNDIILPTRGQRMRIGTYGTLSETVSGASYIQGNNIAADRTLASTLVKTSSASDGCQYIAMRYDRGVWIGTGIGAGNAVGTTYADTVNTRLMITTAGNVGINEFIPDYTLDVNGAIGFTPGSSVTPVDNGDVVFEATSNTQFTIKYKGTDAVVRSSILTLS